MKRLLPLLVLVFLGCASFAESGVKRYVYVQNHAWALVTVYVGPQQRRLGECETNRNCRFRLREGDTPEGILRLSFRELGWPRGTVAWMPPGYADVTWELVIEEMTSLSYVRPMRQIEGRAIE